MTFYVRAYSLALGALLFLLPLPVSAATLTLSPANADVTAGGNFTETLYVGSGGQALNAVSGTVSFPPELLQVVSVSKSNSILSLWIQDPTYSNITGTISFSGVVPNPGFSGNRGQVISIQFRAKKAGTAAIIVDSSSQVLANDGNGTDILTGTIPATISISAQTSPPPAASPSPSPSSTPDANGRDLLARITSSTHPDQSRWYNIPHVVFDWTNAQGVSAVRLGYDSAPDSKPSVVYTEPISHKELDLANGIWYFSVQEKDTSGWGPIGTYKVQIDTLPPLPLTIVFLNGTTTTTVGTTIPIQFATRDELSGIDRYQIVIDDKVLNLTAEEGSKPYAISGGPGPHTLIVRAYDKAGNVATAPETDFFVMDTGKEENVLFSMGWLAVNYLSLLLIAAAILLTLFFGAWYIRVQFTAYRRRLNRQLGLTEARIHKEFDDLKDAITQELLKLEQVKSVRQLTREEEKLISRFKKLLDQSEIDIEKELEQISR